LGADLVTVDQFSTLGGGVALFDLGAVPGKPCVSFVEQLQCLLDHFLGANEQDSRGARCIGAPILDAEGRVRAAISLSGPAARVKAVRDVEIAKALAEACRQISTLLGYTAGFTGRVEEGLR
jgi:hypothetical protein